MTENYKIYFKYVEKLFLFLPLSYVIGTAAVNILTVLLSLIFVCIFQQKKNYFNKKSITLIIIFFLLSINIVFSDFTFQSIYRGLNIIKFFFIGFLFLEIVENNKNFIQQFLKYLVILLLFISFDTLVQFFLGKDIFGFEVQTSHGSRLSGPFGDEYVVGSFISKFAYISSVFFFSSRKYYIGFLYLISLLLITFLSHERSASTMFFITLIIFFLFNNYLSIKLKLALSTSLMFLTISVVLFTPLKKHFIDTTLDQIGITKNRAHNNFFDSQFGAHYLTAIEVFKDNPITGSGLNTFREVCKNIKYDNIKSYEKRARCANHPHNIYLEILSEMGLIGFMFFIAFNIWIFLNYLNFIFFHKSKIEEVTILYFVCYLLLYNPIQTTGSIFSSWNGGIYWMLTFFIIKNVLDNIKILKKND